jgi:hypothetical protein
MVAKLGPLHPQKRKPLYQRPLIWINHCLPGACKLLGAAAAYPELGVRASFSP